MARLANALIPITAAGDALANPGIQEIVDNAIVMVGQIKTPFVSRIKGERAVSPKLEWETDTYLEPVTDAKPYGDQMTPQAYTREKRRQTITETRWTMHSVTKEEQRTLKYGYGMNTRSRIMMKQGISLRVGMERTILNNNQGTQEAAAGNTYVGITPCLEAIITTNTKRGTGGATVGGWTDASKKFNARTRAAAAGNRVVLTMSDIVDLVDGRTEDYSTPMAHKSLWMNRDLRAKLSSYSQSGISQLRTQVMPGSPATVSYGVDMIRTDLGSVVSVNYSPQMTSSNYNVFNVDPAKIKICYMFRNLPVTLGTKGLSDEFGMATNFALKVTDEQGLGALYDRKAA